MKSQKADRFKQSEKAGREKRGGFFWRLPSGSRGVAVLEMVFLLTTLVTLIGITLGLWGAVHSATLQSIAARHYAFEVINNRPHFEYHRDFITTGEHPDPGAKNMSYAGETSAPFYGNNQRMLFIVQDELGNNPTVPYVATRGINFFDEINRSISGQPKGVIKGDRTGYAWEAWGDVSKEGGARKTNPIWLLTGYGICFEKDCGG